MLSQQSQQKLQKEEEKNHTQYSPQLPTIAEKFHTYTKRKNKKKTKLHTQKEFHSGTGLIIAEKYVVVCVKLLVARSLKEKEGIISHWVGVQCIQSPYTGGS